MVEQDPRGKRRVVKGKRILTSSENSGGRRRSTFKEVLSVVTGKSRVCPVVSSSLPPVHWVTDKKNYQTTPLVVLRPTGGLSTTDQ